MKALKKLTVLLMTAILTVSAFSAFGCSRRSDTENDLNINYWQSGYGIEFMNAAIEGFKAKYPQYNVDLYASSQPESVMSGFGRGAKSDPVDLYVSGSINRNTIQYAEPLNDILEEKADASESLTIGQKYVPEVLDSFKYEETDGAKYYNLAFAGSMAGIVYNKTIIDGEEIPVPRTTDELAEVSRMLVEREGNKVYPFINYNEGYWNFFYPVLQAQYDGLDYYKNTFLTLGNQDLSNTIAQDTAKAILRKEDGRLMAMKALEKIITIDTIYPGSGSTDFNSAQTDFLSGEAAMMVNGGWLLNEMNKDKATEEKFTMMRTPVISSIKDKCAKVGGDDELRALIDVIDIALDEGTALEDIPYSGAGFSVDPNDVKIVYEARTIMMSLYNSSVFTIPHYSNAKQAAKDFIKYFYTDVNIKKFSEITQTVMPLQLSTGDAIDMTGWCEFEKVQLEFLNTTSPIYLYNVMPTTNKLFTLGTAKPFPTTNGGLDFPYIFADNDMATNASGYKSADKIWEAMLDAYSDTNFTRYLTTAGFIK